jgi:hypothetical protein
MLGYLLHTNVTVEVSVNPMTWYVFPKIRAQGPTKPFPCHHGLDIFWLFLRVYFYVDNGSINVQAMYEQQEREQNMVSEADL